LVDDLKFEFDEQLDNRWSVEEKLSELKK